MSRETIEAERFTGSSGTRCSRRLVHLAGDHPQQSRKASALIDGDEIFIRTTVLLETEWCCVAVEAAKAMSLLVWRRRMRRSAGKALDRVSQGTDFTDAPVALK
jgi:hypothetical protein